MIGIHESHNYLDSDIDSRISAEQRDCDFRDVNKLWPYVRSLNRDAYAASESGKSHEIKSVQLIFDNKRLLKPSQLPPK